MTISPLSSLKNSCYSMFVSWLPGRAYGPLSQIDGTFIVGPRGMAVLGPYVCRARTKLGLTQKELGDRCGLAQRTIANIETGRPVYLSTLHKLANGLGKADERQYVGLII